jgi:hypothetical protein
MYIGIVYDHPRIAQRVVSCGRHVLGESASRHLVDFGVLNDNLIK